MMKMKIMNYLKMIINSIAIINAIGYVNIKKNAKKDIQDVKEPVLTNVELENNLKIILNNKPLLLIKIILII